MSHGASRTTSSIVGEKTVGRRCAVAAGRRLAAPAEDDEVGLLLRGGLDDALGGVPADAHDRVDRSCRRARSRARAGAAAGRGAPAWRPRRAASPRGPRRCPSAESSPARGSSIAAPSRISSSAVIGLATGMRIRAGERRLRGSRRSSAVAGRSFQRSTRYGLSSSNSRAWRSTRSSACVGRDVAVLDDEAADPAEVDRDQRRDERLERRLADRGAATTRS